MRVRRKSRNALVCRGFYDWGRFAATIHIQHPDIAAADGVLLAVSQKISIRRPRGGLAQKLAVRQLFDGAGAIYILPKHIPWTRLSRPKRNALSIWSPERHRVVGLCGDLRQVVRGELM